MSKIFRLFRITLIIAVFTGIIIVIIKDYQIEKYGKIVIAKLVTYKRYPKQETATFIFHNNNKQTFSIVCTVPIGFSKKNVNKFYKCKWLKKYPNGLHPILDNEITDTSTILKAGFSKIELNKN